MTTKPPFTALQLHRSDVGIAWCATGVVLALIFFTLIYLGATYQTMDYKCIVAGPRSSLALISEGDTLANARFGYWPMARECEWFRADGLGTVVARSETWWPTLTVFAFIAVSVMGLFTAIFPARGNKRSSERAENMI